MPEMLTAAAFTSLRLRYGAQPRPAEVPAAIEHTFSAGRMVDHYLAAPAPEMLKQDWVQALGALTGILFLPGGAGAPWQVVLYGAEEHARAELAMPAAEFDALLAANGITLPGDSAPAAPAK